MAAIVGPKADHDVAYVTDVEGSWERLRSFLEGNPLVRLEGERIVVQPGATFVFGGDAIDRGPWSRKIVRTLLEVKARQPEQVVLLAGNRDLNKLRLPRELTGFPNKRVPPELVNAEKPVLLKWILQHTMGAADAFEHRRTELSAEGRAHDDGDVVQSYLDDLAPGGDLGRYYDALQLAFRSGRTLFVHGGIAEEALTIVPGFDDVPLAQLDIDAWAERLHTFYARQMDAFRARAIEPDGTPAWQNAILYQAPKKGMKSNPGSVVYGRMSDELNNPLLPGDDVVRALLRAGISRVVVGHTPSGDTPSIVRATSTAEPFEVITADNSRSRVETGSRVVVRDALISSSGRCVLDDKTTVTVEQTLPLDDRTSAVGRRTASGQLVKAGVGDGWLLFRYLPGYEVNQELRRELGALTDAVP